MGGCCSGGVEEGEPHTALWRLSTDRRVTGLRSKHYAIVVSGSRFRRLYPSTVP